MSNPTLTASFVSTLANPLLNSFTTGTTAGWVIMLTFSYDVELLVTSVTLFPSTNQSTSSLAPGIQELTYTNGTSNLTSLSATKYLLTINNAEVLPDVSYSADIACKISGSSSGTVIVISDTNPLSLPVVPDSVTIGTNKAVLSRGPYGTDNIITILFTEPSNYTDGPTFSYKIAMQYTDGTSSVYNYDTSELLNYNNTIGGIEWELSSAVDEGFVAVSAVATYDDDTQLYSAVSNTVALYDSSVPQPVDDLAINYNYTLSTAILSWSSNPTDFLTDVSKYDIYQKIGNNPFLLTKTVNFSSTTTDYESSITINNETITPGTVVSFYIKSVNSSIPPVSSVPSSTVSITVVRPSSRPTLLTGYAISNANTQDVVATFKNPGYVAGNVVGASFVVSVYAIQPDTSGASSLSTKEVAYDSNTLQYHVNFDNIPYFSSTTTYFLTAYLRTLDPNSGNYLIGERAIATFTSGPKPYIAEYNNTIPLTWTTTSSPTRFSIYTSVNMLSSVSITYINAERVYVNYYSELNSGGEDNSYPLPVPVSSEQPYSFDGENNYQFNNENLNVPSNSTILSIVASSSSGTFSSVHINGPLVNNNIV